MNNKKTAGEIEMINNEFENTTHTAEADSDLGVTDVSIKKFKNVKGLLNAYNALESEFTRRCQRIKELERENAILKEGKLLNNSSDDWREREKSAFLEIYPDANDLLQLLLDMTAISGDKSKGRLGRAYLSKLNDEFNKEKEYFNSYEFIKQSLDLYPNIKNEIIREYLLGVDSSKPNVKLITGNGQATITPALKPKNLAEAGLLAQHIFEKRKENIKL